MISSTKSKQSALPFLRTMGQRIIDEGGREVRLRGVNLGGWLMMEAYFMFSPNLPVHRFEKNFRKALGAKALEDFHREFRRNFIREEDFDIIKKMGCNCLRLPFHYRVVEPESLKPGGRDLRYIDQAIQWAGERGIYVILDLHAAPGAQNHDWHSDSDGKALFWSSARNQQRALKIWEFLAKRYKENSTVAGFDLLNEAVLTDTKKLNRYYSNAIERIRQVGSQQIIFIEGNNWAQDIDCLDEFDDANYALSIHNYEPLDFTFNFVPFLRYPLKREKSPWNKQIMTQNLQRYARVAVKRNVPVLVGEFGVNAREGWYGEDRWLADTLDAYDKFGFHWTYWTYKAIKNFTFPDGLYSYRENPPWVHREGPVTGWDTYAELWPKEKKNMIASWRTEAFTPNQQLIKVFQTHVR